jgi:hypothetical protein
MTLINIAIVLIVVGVLMWLVNSFIPMASGIKRLLNAGGVIVLIVWLLQVFGLWHYATRVRLTG